VKQFVRFIRRQLDERHVVRNAGVVDEHGEFLSRAHVGNRSHTGIRAKVGNQRTDGNVWERSDEFFEPLPATADDHQVVPGCAEPEGKGLADARGCAGNQCQQRAAAKIAMWRAGGFIHVEAFLSRARFV
jgi:hypothetical protein